MPRNVSSWLNCLIRGCRRRQQRRAVSAASAAAGVERLEDRTLLTVVPFAAESVVTLAADGARSLSAADIDGDGDLDYLSASENDDTIAWWENVAGDGSAFVQHAVTTFAVGARSVTAADIDGDGDLDIVSASSVDDTIAWYENTAGDGSAWTETEISTVADGARSVAVADVDGDGDLDVISASYLDDKIAWYDNTAGDGSAWTINVVTTTADGANSVVAADIDGDGDIDFASASLLDDTISWYDNTKGDGTAFTATAISTTSTGASSVFAADIDGDGDIDIVSAASGDDTVSWNENNGAATPTFTERVVNILADGVNQVIAADVDSDGDLDILAASSLDDTISWFDNDGDLFEPVFTARTISTSADGAYSVVAADIDGDGDIDVSSASGLDDKLALYKNETIHRDAAFAAPATLSSTADGAYSVVTGDIDGDGDLDVVASSLYDNSIRWYENDGDSANPSFTERTVATSLNGPRQIHLADVDGDGNLDIVTASAVNNTVQWWENSAGNGSAWTAKMVDASATAVRSVFSGDINGDGNLDLLSASSGDNTIRWYEQTVVAGFPNTFTVRTIATDVTGARTVVAGDVDGDGDLDVVTASYDDDRVLWYENINGDGTVWARRILTSSADGARSVAVADVDNDGDLDILSASTYDNTIRWFENDGTANPLFTERVLSTGEQGAQYVNAADFDNDGDIDIISVAEFPDLTDVSRIAWFENDGAADPSFTRNTIDTKNDRPVTIDTGDIDGDGDPDVVSASIFDDTVLFYRNGGGQLGLTTEDTSASFITAGKFDDVLKITATHNGRAGDGDLEIASFALKFERSPGVPLTTPQANLLVFDLEIFLDDGDGVFDVADDTSVVVVDPLALDLDGNQIVTFADNDPNVLITQGTPRVYFVVVETTANSFLLSPKSFVVTHMTEVRSTAEDAANDIPATIGSVANVSTPLLTSGKPAVPLPGVPTLTGPVGITTDTTPTFTWTPPVGAERYDLQVFDVESGLQVIDQTSFSGASFTPLTPLSVNRTYEVFVQAINVANQPGGFSTPEYFSIDPVVPAPPAPVLTGPTTTVFDTTPTVTWTAATGAVNYELLIYNRRTGQEVSNPSSIAATKFTFAAPLPPDPYQVFVRANNAGGSSAFSTPLNFSTLVPVGLPAAPILTGPATSIPDNTPTITWTAFPAAVDYELLVYSMTLGVEVLSVGGVPGTEFTTPALATPDMYQVFVRANLGGAVKTVYSLPLIFTSTTAAPIPGVTNINTPTRDSADGTPTFVWDRIPAATTYDIVAYNITTGQQVFFATGLGARFFVPGAALAPGSYQVHVRGVNGAGEAGTWSAPLSFGIAKLDAEANEPKNSPENSLENSLENLPATNPLTDEPGLADVVALADENKDTANSDRAVAALSQESIFETTNQRAFATQSEINAAIVANSQQISEPASVDTVMVAWPEMEWWIADEQPADAEMESFALRREQAVLGAAVLGLAIPALNQRRETNGTKSRKRRRTKV